MTYSRKTHLTTGDTDRIVDGLMLNPMKARAVQARLEERLMTTDGAKTVVRPADTSQDDLWDNVPV